MLFKQISIYTLLPEFGKIINENNSTFENYLNVFYDSSVNMLKTPLTTSGSVKASKGEFVTVVTDNLVVRKQYVNTYENITTSNYDWYNTYTNGITLTRNASTWENNLYKYVDVDKPYYKVFMDSSISLRNNNLSQIVELIIDASGTGSFHLLLDPSGSTYTVSGSVSAGENVTLMNVKYDVSYGSSWVVMSSNGSGTKSINMI